MKIALGADHGGFELKKIIAEFLKSSGHEVLDVGAFRMDAKDDYPDFSRAVAEALLSNKAERGILVCGSGVGASIAANKFPGVRAAVCHDAYSARQGVEDDDMNVLSLGARVVGPGLAKELVRAFIGARFLGEERFRRRLRKVEEIERSKKEI